MNPIEHIDEYMSGKLIAEDRAAFEQAMLTDADLRNLVENYESVREVSSGILEAELLSEVQEVTQATAPPLPKDNPSKRYLLVAALLLALAAAIFWISQSGTHSDGEINEIMAFYMSPPNENNTRSAGITISDEFELTISKLEGIPTLTDTATISYLDVAKRYFHLNQFKNSKSILEEIQSKTSNEDLGKEISYWLGHVYFNIGYDDPNAEDYKKTRAIFQKFQFPESPCMIQLCAVLLYEQPKETLDSVCSKNLE